jgi:hypothetical protein
LLLAVPITTALAAFVASAKIGAGAAVDLDEPEPYLPEAHHSRSDQLVPAAVAEVATEISGEPSAVHGEHVVDGGLDHIHTDNETIAVEPEENGQINPEAYPPVPPKRRFGLPRRSTNFNRKMSRRERKFWSD